MISGKRLVVFDSDLRTNLFPLTLTKPAFELSLGTGSLLDKIEQGLGAKAETLVVPKYLQKLTAEKYPNAAVNEAVSQKCVLVNSQVSPSDELFREIEHASKQGECAHYDSSRNLVFAVRESFEPSTFKRGNLGKSRKVRFVSPLIRYPWELVSANSQVLTKDYASWKRKTSSRQGEKLDKRITLAESATLERYVTLDTRSGPIMIDEEAEVQSFSRLEGPCYVGKGTKIKSAQLRAGTSIGNDCRISGEVEASIISEYTNKNHEGFIGHSYLGSWINLGALTTNSDLKNTYGTIKVSMGSKLIDSGAIKVGVFMGDMCKTSIGSLLLSGKSVGVSSHVFGAATENIASFTFYSKSGNVQSKEVELKSAIVTQRRMMQRREQNMTEGYGSMMRTVFEITQKERTLAGVKKGKFAM